MHTQQALALTGFLVSLLGAALICTSLYVLQHNDPVLIAGSVGTSVGIVLMVVSGCCGGSQSSDRERPTSSPPRQAAARAPASQQETPEQVAARRQAGLQKLRDLELGKM